MSFWNLIQSESYRRGTLFSFLFNILAKGLLFLLTIIIARYFGSNVKTDIYFFVFGTMVLLSGFMSTLDTSVIIPQSMRLRKQQGDDAATAFLNYFMAWYLLVGIVFSVLMYFFGTAVFSLISKFSAADIALYRQYFGLGSMFFLLMILTNYLNAVLVSLKFFSIPMLISAVNSCIVIAVILLLYRSYDVLIVIMGGLLAYAINLLLLFIILLKATGWKFKFRYYPLPGQLRKNIFYAELGQAATIASSMVPLYFLSGFGGGIISTMTYGKNIADIPNSLVTSQLSNVSGIKLNEQAAAKDYAGMNDTFLRTAKLLIFLLLPIGFYLFVFAKPIAAVLFMGRNFSVQGLDDTSMFLRLFSITLFSVGLNALVTRIFISLQAIKQAFIYQVVLNVILVLAIWWFISLYGAFGYPAAIIAVNLLNIFGMYIICKKLMPALNYITAIRYTSKLILINAAIASMLYLLINLPDIGNIYKLSVAAGVYLLILWVLNKRFQLNTEIYKLTNDLKK